MPRTTAERRAGAKFPLDHDPEKLRDRRINAGREQAEVAAAAGISAGYLSELENGTRNPSPPVLARLAVALKCEVSDLRAKRKAAR